MHFIIRFIASGEVLGSRICKLRRVLVISCRFFSWRLVSAFMLFLRPSGVRAYCHLEASSRSSWHYVLGCWLCHTSFMSSEAEGSRLYPSMSSRKTRGGIFGLERYAARTRFYDTHTICNFVDQVLLYFRVGSRHRSFERDCLWHLCGHHFDADPV